MANFAWKTSSSLDPLNPGLGLDWDSWWDLTGLQGAEAPNPPEPPTSTRFVQVIPAEDVRIEFTGVNFGNLDIDGNPTTGTINQIKIFSDGVWVSDLSGISMEVGTFIGFVLSGNNAGFLAQIFAGADTISGNVLDDTLRGLGGDDTLIGGAGADVLDGGTGAGDWADYSTSSAAVSVNLASATSTGGDAQGDSLIAIENLRGSSLADALTGDVGNNALDGGDGDDTLVGGAGADAFNGGAQADVVDYSTAVAGVSVDMTTTLGSTGDGAGDTFTGVENLRGSSHADALTGDDAANALWGDAGGDTLNGSAGADTLRGEADLDTLNGGSEDDILIGGAGGDVLNGGAGSGDWADYSTSASGVTVNLQTGAASGGDAAGDTLQFIEYLRGSAQADTLTGNTLNNWLFGGFGADQIFGGDGGDLLQGEGDADTLNGEGGIDSLAGGDGDDVLIGGAGADSLGGGAGIDTADYSTSTAVIVNLQTAATSGGDAAGDTFASIENVIGSAFADTLTGRDGFANTLTGGDGNDVLSGGTGGADVMNGGAGIDTLDYSLSPNGVDVRLFSGVAAGGSANGDSYSSIENIIGAATKTDTLAGDANANSIWGGGGNETITGRENTDTLYGEAGNDTLLGGADSDVLIGGIGADTLGGGSQDDTADYSASDAGVTVNLQAGAGFGGHAQGDALVSIEDVIGSAFADVIIGKNNFWDNIFDGRGGDDTYTGGLGDDVFVFRLNEGADTITDFGAGGAVDAVELHGFGFSSFTEIIAAATQVGADTIIDFGAGQTLTLQNVALANLSSGDFIFGGG